MIQTKFTNVVLASAALSAAHVLAYFVHRKLSQKHQALLPNLTFLKIQLSCIRLPLGSTVFPSKGRFFSTTYTEEEISIVCESEYIPQTTASSSESKIESDWVMFKVEGPLDFALIGILSHLSSLLARKYISIFAISTYDTDYVMLKSDQKAQAIKALRDSGYAVREE